MLPRVLEPELMDTAEDACEYDAMDHAEVNNAFVTDLLGAVADWSLKRRVQIGAREKIHVLDLGAGTALIPIELARRAPHLHITAVDAAESMLSLARANVARAGLAQCIEVVEADAKRLPFEAASFGVVISNSIVHHIADPSVALGEAVRVGARESLQFHRDLVRPADERTLELLVATYAAGATHSQRKLFADSLRAALTLEEMRALVTGLGFSAQSVQQSSDRHWTWAHISHHSPALS